MADDLYDGVIEFFDFSAYFEDPVELEETPSVHSDMPQPSNSYNPLLVSQTPNISSQCQPTMPINLSQQFISPGTAEEFGSLCQDTYPIAPVVSPYKSMKKREQVECQTLPLQSRHSHSLDHTIVSVHRPEFASSHVDSHEFATQQLYSNPVPMGDLISNASLLLGKNSYPTSATHEAHNFFSPALEEQSSVIVPGSLRSGPVGNPFNHSDCVLTLSRYRNIA